MSTTNHDGRKQYTPPTVVRHGGAVEKTLGGIMGGFLEVWGWRRIIIP